MRVVEGGMVVSEMVVSEKQAVCGCCAVKSVDLSKLLLAKTLGKAAASFK